MYIYKHIFIYVAFSMNELFVPFAQYIKYDCINYVCPCLKKHFILFVI